MTLIELFQNQLLNVVAWIFIIYVVITLILEMIKRLWNKYGGMIQIEDSSDTINTESGTSIKK